MSDDGFVYTAAGRTPKANGRHTNGHDRLPTVAFENIRPRIDIPYIVKGWFYTGEVSGIIGEPGCGKSTWMLRVCVHAAAVIPWYGYRLKQTAVIYVSCESGAELRIAALRGELGLEDFLDIPFRLVSASIDLRTNQIAVRQIIEAIHELQADFPGLPIMVVIDTLARAMNGGDENSSEDMGLLIANVDRIRQSTGAHVALIHHCGKDPGRGARGHSSLKGAIDTEITVERNAVSKVVSATLSKQRNASSNHTVAFKLVPIDLGTDTDGDQTTACIAQPVDNSEQSLKETKLTANQKTMLAILKDAGPGGLELSRFHDLCREGGIGLKRRSDLLDVRLALKAKHLIYEYDNKWFCQS